MAFGGMGGSGGPMSEINTTPLVDVMLVLLVVFILIAPVVTHRIKVELPTQTTETNDAPPQTITLAVSGEGDVFWNDIAITDEELKIRLYDVGQKAPESELQIRADKTVKYKRLQVIMGYAQNNGVVKLGFITKPNKEQE